MLLNGARACCCAVALAVTVVGAPAWSATVRVLSKAPQNATPLVLNTSDFQRVGHCGSGESVVNNGCSTVIKRNPDAPHAFGRFDPLTNDYWIDSQDIDELKWTVNAPVPFSSLIFALTDAHDQPDSHFAMSIQEGEGWTSLWEIPDRQENGNLYWLSVDFAEPVTSTALLFSTRSDDGYGIRAASISDQPAPVPLPASAAFLLASVGGLAMLRRRKTSA
jgi:hypothetical protein